MERKEPTLSGGANDISDRDDSANRRAAVENTRPTRPAAPVASAPHIVQQSNSLALFAFILALAGLGVGGFFGWKFIEAQTVLQQSEARIVELENRLSVTSDESSQSLTQVDAKLKLLDSEVRKLWGISNDVNRKAIAANKENIASLAKELAETKKEAGAAKTAAKNQKTELDTNKAAVDDAVAKIETALLTISEQRKRLQDFTEQVDRVEGQLGTLRTLEEKVKASEESIAAIDAYRRTINRDILEIKQRLNTPATP